MGYEITYLPQFCLTSPSALQPPLSATSTFITETSRNCMCQTFIHYTSTSILWKQIYLLEDEIHTRTYITYIN